MSIRNSPHTQAAPESGLDTSASIASPCDALTGDNAPALEAGRSELFNEADDIDNLGECRGCGRYGPICAELDGDTLCHPCANDWAQGEEDAFREAMRGEDWQ